MERRPSGWYSGERTAGCRARTWDLSVALSNWMVAELQSVIPVSSKMKWASEECSNRTRKRSAIGASSGCGVIRLAPQYWGPVCKRVAYDEPSFLLPRENIRIRTYSEPGSEAVDGLERNSSPKNRPTKPSGKLTGVHCTQSCRQIRRARGSCNTIVSVADYRCDCSELSTEINPPRNRVKLRTPINTKNPRTITCVTTNVGSDCVGARALSGGI